MKNCTGPRIRDARIELGISQSELAFHLESEGLIGCTQSDISEIERGVRSVKDFELQKIATVLKVSISRLFEVDER
jgi:transcriptional regulator with XRE-family HTH domain